MVKWEKNLREKIGKEFPTFYKQDIDIIVSIVKREIVKVVVEVLDLKKNQSLLKIIKKRGWF